MLNERIVELGTQRSVIRELFEFGKMRAAEIGAENVFDFSIGNPSVPSPDAVNETAIKLIKEMDPVLLHGYTSAQGDAGVRQMIADSINRRFGTAFGADNLYVTVGAAAALCCCLNGLCNPQDEVIVFAPYFPEYKVFIEGAGASRTLIPADVEAFQIDFNAFEKALNPNTKAVIINSPNNPSGAVYSEETIRKMAAIMEAKQKEYGTDIYLISDEPYRELVYDGAEVPYLTKYYANTIVGYSYSKSLSLPGERIGYLVIPDEVTDSEDIKSAANVATRILGFVNAPTLQQKLVAKCINEKTDLSFYNRNREALYDGLRECGFECIKPEGAFYLFVKSPVEDEKQFCADAKELHILMVPGSSFACPGYVRLAYCVSYETIMNSLPKFKELAKKYF